MASRTVDGDIYTETLAAIDAAGAAGEPLTTPEIADELEMDRRTVYERLSTLAEDGLVETKKVGSGGRVWWRPPETTDPSPIDGERASTRHEYIIEALGDSVCEVDPDGTITYVNDRFRSMLGYEDPVGEHASTFMETDDLHDAGERLESLASSGRNQLTKAEYDLIARDGERIPVENHILVKADADGTFRGTIGVIRDIRQRRESEAKLRRQQDRLVALNNLHAVVRDITEAVLDRSTRPEIEATVCERLADSESYTAAWIAEVDPDENELSPRVEAGDSGYSEEVDISIDPADSTGQGPAGRAARTRRTQVSRDVLADPTFEPWQDQAKEYGFRSCAAIPIVHESSMFGLICVYSERPDAFSEDELRVITQLGEVVGHAIAAAERKRAMMSDEVVEIGYQCRDFLGRFGIDATVEGIVELQQTVPIGDGSYLLYGTAHDGAIEAIERLVEADTATHYESYSVLNTDPSQTQFEVRLSEAPIPSVVSTHGGYIGDARLVDDDLSIQLNVPPGTNINRLTAEMRECYPGIEPITRRQKTREKRTSEQFTSVLESELTDRQLAALEAGYFSGFFEWPRDSSGTEVAASLNISPATFHQHVRTAERKILDQLFNAE
ncbi:bacterio-opsin activator domain-containing protein [Halovivax gelatinilyticus]|uniref:bacterio-opsin activator domain-containing protein n=1 Tax=Halovivax gelatinilyticus TaxID=2961597 RepID=UPI0020CA78FD|nr:bacterio-opsin activator domain-containing protein [Halovivax gelatinilyticus]